MKRTRSKIAALAVAYDYSLRVVLILLGALLVLAVIAALSVGKSHAASDDFDTEVMVIADRTDRIVLEQTPCASELTAFFPPGMNVRAATYVVGAERRTVAGCWAVKDKHVYAMFEDMDRYKLAKELFRRGTLSEKQLGGSM